MVSVCLRSLRLFSPLWKRGAGGDFDRIGEYLTASKSPLTPLFQRGGRYVSVLILLLTLSVVAPLAHAEISINAHIDNPNPWLREEILLTVEFAVVNTCLRSLRLLSPLWKRGAGGDFDRIGEYLTASKSPLTPLFQRGGRYVSVLILLLTLSVVAPLAHAEISINAHIDNPNPWLREEILLTVEVVDDRSIIEQNTAPWAPPGVSLRPLNPSEERVQTADGIRILRRQHWAIMPLYAGELKLQPPTIEARITGQGRVSLTPEAMLLNVRPLNPLLPADVPVSALQIKLAHPPEAVPRGRPFNVNLSIESTGLSTRSLRRWLDENLRSMSDLRIYPPDIRLNNNIDPAKPLLQQADIRLTFESQASGQLTLPSLVLPYVNSQDGNIQHTTLPIGTVRIEHPLWLALRPWLPRGMVGIALIVLLIATWTFTRLRLQAAKQRRTWRRELQTAESPKALRQILRKMWRYIPATSGTKTLSQQLDAACYGSEPISAAVFNDLKARLIEYCSGR